MKKEDKNKILEVVKKATSDEYETTWDEKGRPVSKKKTNIQRGKKARASGAKFELKVREELKKTNWILDKWTNNVDLEKQEVVPAKRKFNPYAKVMTIGTGFPDFVGVKHVGKGAYDVIGIEVKVKGYLSQEEKIKCKFYLQNKIFSKVFIATAVKEGRKVEVKLIDFMDKYKKKYDTL